MQSFSVTSIFCLKIIHLGKLFFYNKILFSFKIPPNPQLAVVHLTETHSIGEVTKAVSRQDVAIQSQIQGFK